MAIEDKFLKYIYSSAPLQGSEFPDLKHHGIFKNYFADNPFRKPILAKIQRSLSASQGGVFLISGYRGIGKTTFLNYILHNIQDSTFLAHLNLSEIKFDFKFELICRMITALQEQLKSERDKQFESFFQLHLKDRHERFCDSQGAQRIVFAIRNPIVLYCYLWKFLYRRPVGRFLRRGLKEILELVCLAIQKIGNSPGALCDISENLHRLKDLEDIHEFSNECRKLFEMVFYEKEVSQGFSAEFSGKRLLNHASLAFNRKLRQKENIFLYEQRLKVLLQRVKKHPGFGRDFIFVLDELDKLPVSSMKTGFRRDPEVHSRQEKEARGEKGLNVGARKYQKMEWLLKMLSDIKSFLFESGAVFILIVNKDVYDCWMGRHSQEDLFMNLVTNVEYLPNYTKEEMELHPDFPISLAEDVEIPYPLSPHALKKYFQTTMYYESYGNPRLYFQNLSKKIKNNEIRINRDEAKYLLTKFKLYEMNELIYNYVYKDNEQIFGRFLFGVDDISEVFQHIDEIESSLESESDPDCHHTEIFLKPS